MRARIVKLFSGPLWSLVLMATLYSASVAYLEFHVLQRDPAIRSDLHALLGTVLGLFLVFRTNTAYDRWWEGRKLWGQLVNDSRNLVLVARAFVKLEKAELVTFARLSINFARALKEHLRDGVRPQQLSVYNTLDVEPNHVPSHIAGMIWERISHWQEQGLINGYELLVLQPHARAFMDICGACERIRKTPLALSYRRFMVQCISIYLITLPWGLIHDFKYWAIPATSLISYFMIGVIRIAEDVEEPFGREKDDLVLDEICHTIQQTLLEIATLPKRLEG